MTRRYLLYDPVVMMIDNEDKCCKGWWYQCKSLTDEILEEKMLEDSLLRLLSSTCSVSGLSRYAERRDRHEGRRKVQKFEKKFLFAEDENSHWKFLLSQGKEDWKEREGRRKPEQKSLKQRAGVIIMSLVNESGSQEERGRERRSEGHRDKVLMERKDCAASSSITLSSYYLSLFTSLSFNLLELKEMMWSALLLSSVFFVLMMMMMRKEICCKLILFAMAWKFN